MSEHDEHDESNEQVAEPEKPFSDDTRDQYFSELTSSLLRIGEHLTSSLGDLVLSLDTDRAISMVRSDFFSSMEDEFQDLEYQSRLISKLSRTRSIVGFLVNDLERAHARALADALATIFAEDPSDEVLWDPVYDFPADTPLDAVDDEPIIQSKKKGDTDE